jgi:hypothetical protein
VEKMMQQVESIHEPKERLRAFISIPFSIPTDEYTFWKLLYSLKWQMKHYDESLSQQMKNFLIETFRRLKFKNAEAEADLLLMLFDGIAAAILLKDLKETEQFKQTLFKKYQV